MSSLSVIACSVCMAPGHKTTEAIGYAILALLLFMVPLFVGVVAFFVKLNRRARAVAAADAEAALHSDTPQTEPPLA